VSQHFLLDTDLSAEQQAAVLADAGRRKLDRLADPILAGRSVAVVFEKASTRTRVSFDVGIHELGGHAVVLDAQGTQLVRGEPMEDTARVLSRQVCAVVLRTFGQERIEALAAASTVPVINALTDTYHPCQILADLQTAQEHFGAVAGLTLTYVGDGNNMAHSYLLGGATAGMHVRVASPNDYRPDAQVVAAAEQRAAQTGGSITLTDDRFAAAEGAHVVCTDVWASMGHEDQATQRTRAFNGWQINTELMSGADPAAIVLHCLPAHRGEEISGEVLDGPQSAVWDQAENRLHAQKALLAHLIGAP
jgi:ornithine carbamoyltransferase